MLPAALPGCRVNSLNDWLINWFPCTAPRTAILQGGLSFFLFLFFFISSTNALSLYSPLNHSSHVKHFICPCLFHPELADDMFNHVLTKYTYCHPLTKRPLIIYRSSALSLELFYGKKHLSLLALSSSLLLPGLSFKK